MQQKTEGINNERRDIPNRAVPPLEAVSHHLRELRAANPVK